VVLPVGFKLMLSKIELKALGCGEYPVAIKLMLTGFAVDATACVAIGKAIESEALGINLIPNICHFE